MYDMYEKISDINTRNAWKEEATLVVGQAKENEETSKTSKEKNPKREKKKEKVLNTSIDKVYEVYTLWPWDSSFFLYFSWDPSVTWAAISLVVEFGFFAIENLKKTWKFVCLGFKCAFFWKENGHFCKN